MNIARAIALYGFAVAATCFLATNNSTAGDNDPGISADKPSEGPSVKVEGGYMVPYTFRVPGTDREVEMLPVPGGEFMFGSPEDEDDRNEDEGQQIKVTVDPMWVA